MNIPSSKTTSCHRMRNLVKVRNFLSQEKNSCHMKKLAVTGIKFLSKETLPVTGRSFLSQEETSWHTKKLPVTWRIFLSQEETSYHSYLLTTTKIFGQCVCLSKKLLKEEISCHWNNSLITRRRFFLNWKTFTNLKGFSSSVI